MKDTLHDTLSAPQGKSDLSSQEARIAEIEATVNMDSVPEGFEVDDEGVWFLQPKKDAAPTREWVCTPLWVTAYTRDHRNENHGRVLEFYDLDGCKHQWTMAMDWLATEGNKIIGALLNMGLRIATTKKEKDRLLEYVAQATPTRKARCVSQCGWFKKAFVLPSGVIGYLQGEKIVYQNAAAPEIKGGESGALVDWQELIANKAVGNSRLILAISAAFAAPLLHLLNHENIGVHYRGNSSLGKSTAGRVGNSVWGPPTDIHTFRATANGLEGIASLHNDRLLSLDELGQISPSDAGPVVYMLGNGMGKGRATNLGLARKAVVWRVVFISTGEMSLEQVMAEAGKRTRAGQEVRFIEVPADTGAHGLFENLQGFENGAAFSSYLKETCDQLYGTAAREFLRKLVEDEEGAISISRAIIEGIRQRYALPKHASPQVHRVFNHFALLAAAGELASQFVITGWEVEIALEGVMRCFTAWCDARGDLGMQEEVVALSQVKTFFELHGESRFSPWDKPEDDKSRTSNRTGFRKEGIEGTEFYVFRDLFRNEICRGLDYRFVEKVCIKHRLLSPAPDGTPTRSERLPAMRSTQRCYRFTLEPFTERE